MKFGIRCRRICELHEDGIDDVDEIDCYEEYYDT